MHRPHLTRTIATFIFSLALIANAPAAFAAPVFQVIVNGGQGPIDRSSSSALSDGSFADGGIVDPITGTMTGGSDNAFAAAGPGELRVDANSKLFFFGSTAHGGDRIIAAAEAAMTLDDVIISGPTGMLTTTYSLHISGNLEASKVLPIPSDSSNANASVSVRLFDNLGRPLNDFMEVIRDDQTRVGFDFTGSPTLTSNPFSVTANEAFAITVRLGAGAFTALEGDVSGTVRAGAHFSNTLTFVTDSPVFNLPAGYTANSISGNISNNHFVSAVPAPAGVLLLATGIAALGGRRLLRPRVRWHRRAAPYQA